MRGHGRFIPLHDELRTVRRGLFLAALLAIPLTAAAQPVPVADIGTVVADACNSNGIIDPNEEVTVSLGIRNTGINDTIQLVATLQPTGGVTNPGGPQDYGVVVAGGPPVFRSFTFTSGSLACGLPLVATLALDDAGTGLGNLTYSFQVGGVAATPTNASTGDIAVPIVDVATIEVPLTVPETIAIGDVNVSFRLNHTFDADLDINLVHPDGTVVPLLSDVGASGDNFGSGANDCAAPGTVLDDQAATLITSGIAPFAGSFRPESPLAVLNGKPATGVWKLVVTDDVGGDVGTVGCFKLQIRRAVCCGSINAGAPVTVTAENHLPLNSTPDPGETLTVTLPIVNVGADTTNLVATLQSTGGVTSPSGPQSYGVVVGGGAAVARPFTFTAVGNCGSTITLTLALVDDGVSVGTVRYTLPLGTPAAPLVFANPAPIAIPNSGVATPYPSSIVVSGVGPVGRVSVRLKQFSHTFPDDVDVLLVGPTGRAFILMSDAGSSNDAANADILFDDAAPTLLPATIVSGTFRPTNEGTGDSFAPPAPGGPYLSPEPAGSEGLGSAFAGLDPNGTWSLFVVDDVGGDTGTFAGGWEIAFTQAVCSNTPPIARDDAFTANEDAPLSVPPPGLLDNDTDLHGFAMTVAIVTAPTNGAITALNPATGAFTYTPAGDYFGPDAFTYRAVDVVGPSNLATVSLTVNPVNDAPSFTMGPNQHVVGGAPTTVSGWATAMSSGPPNESAQTLAFLVSNNGPALFTSQPAVSATGTLTFDPAPGANGVATVTVRLQDNGGTANGGVDTSAPQTFTIRVVDLVVNSANDVDDGVCNATHCSLREAIVFANSSPNLSGPDRISFAIPGTGVRTIPVASPIPAVAEPAIIDGRTQPGYTLTTPLIELDGTLAGTGTRGLALTGGQSTVAGLVINRFEGHGLTVTGPGENGIVDNFIGTDRTGLSPLPNGGSGIRISGSPDNNVFSNVLSGNEESGLRIDTAPAARNNVVGNRIGVGRDGTTPVPNGESGVFILASSGNWIGRSGSFAENIIAHNNRHGVQVSTGSQNTIIENQIHSNGLLGIELGADGVTPNDTGDGDSGANALQNYPVLSRANVSPTHLAFSGTLDSTPNTTFGLQFYVSTSCDGSGFGEGQRRINDLDVTTGSNGQAVIQIDNSSGFPAEPAGQYLTVNATSPNGSTSEFSACRLISPLPTLTLTGGETAGVLRINEGNPTGGPPTQSLTFFVTLSAPNAFPVTVPYRTTDQTAQSPSDFTAVSGFLTFAPGEVTKQIVVQTVLDMDPEADETFTISVGPAGPITNAVLAQSSITVVLADDDGAEGPLAVSIADTAGSEPRTGSRPIPFTVTLSDAAFHTVWVDYTTLAGTATAGLDYTAASGQLIFQPGERTKTVSVNVLADALREGVETFHVSLTHPEGAILGRGQGTARVGDPGSFATLTPCRLIDSRLGAGALFAGELREIQIIGGCSVPSTAIAVSVNLTVTQVQSPGFLEAFPSDRIAPATSVINFRTGQTRANNAVFVLSQNGKVTLKNVSSGNAHFIIDVNGYFE